MFCSIVLQLRLESRNSRARSFIAGMKVLLLHYMAGFRCIFVLSYFCCCIDRWRDCGRYGFWRVILLSIAAVVSYWYVYCCAASFEVRQLYKQFVVAVVELMGGEVVSEEFQEVAVKAYRLFSATFEAEEDERDKRILSKKWCFLFIFLSGKVEEFTSGGSTCWPICFIPA